MMYEGRRFLKEAQCMISFHSLMVVSTQNFMLCIDNRKRGIKRKKLKEFCLKKKKDYKIFSELMVTLAANFKST